MSKSTVNVNVQITSDTKPIKAIVRELKKFSPLSDKKLLEVNAHIPTEQVLQDIADTQYEINKLTRHNELRRAGKFNRDDRICDMKVRAVEAQIAERKEFVADLERLLRLREAV